MKKIILISSKLFFCIFMMFVAITAIAQSKKIPLISQKQEHVLQSKINGTKYYLSVSLPMHYSPTDTIHYPVLYMLDGGISFPIAHASRSTLDMFGELEDVIIVGFEYEWKLSRTPWMMGRWRDDTPSKNEKADANPGIIKNFGLQPGELSSGGAPVFLEVIKKEIIPFIDKVYKTTNDRGINGHSLGGLFATYCLLSSPGLFQRYGITSPSLDWNNMEMVKLEKSFSEKTSGLPVRVFMSAGSLEENGMTKGMNDFADSLRSHYEDIRVMSTIFDNEDHMSVIPGNISRMLRVLYGKKRN